MVGRPKGLPKTGGRKKGTPNRLPTARRAAAARAVAEGVTPLEVMLEAMRAHRDKGELTAAAAIAKDAAPYCHPRLSSAEVTVKKSPLDDLDPATLAALEHALERGEGGAAGGDEAATRH